MSQYTLEGSDLIAFIDELRLPSGAVAVLYLGQSGFVLKGATATVYVDPYLSGYLEDFTRGRPDEDPRHFLPPLVPADVTNADLFFGTHYHYDHIDPGLVEIMQESSPDCTFVVPVTARRALLRMGVVDDRIITPPVNEPQQIKGVQFVSIPAAHEDFDYDPESGYPYRGYVLTLDNVNIYHAGDTIPYDGLVERLQALAIDIALLPINGRDYFRLNRGFPGNFTYREAAELASAINAKLLIPMHFGMHMANSEKPGYLIDYLAENFPQQRSHVMVPGELFLYLKTNNMGIVSFLEP